MAVLVVITILALMTVPAMLDCRGRQQIEVALPLADVAKKPVTDWHAFTGEWPADNETLELPAADKIVSNHVSALNVENGAIRLNIQQQCQQGAARQKAQPAARHRARCAYGASGLGLQPDQATAQDGGSGSQSHRRTARAVAVGVSVSESLSAGGAAEQRRSGQTDSYGAMIAA